MPSSHITIPLEYQPVENPANFLEGRLGAELSHGKRVRRLGQLIDFVIIGQIKAYFHSVHRHAVSVHAALSAPNQPRIDASHMLVGYIVERLVREVHGLIKDRFMVHASIVRRAGAGFHSYCPVVSVITSSLFFAYRGLSIAVKAFARDSRSHRPIDHMLPALNPVFVR